MHRFLTNAQPVKIRRLEMLTECFSLPRYPLTFLIIRRIGFCCKSTIKDTS